MTLSRPSFTFSFIIITLILYFGCSRVSAEINYDKNPSGMVPDSTSPGLFSFGSGGNENSGSMVVDSEDNLIFTASSYEQFDKPKGKIQGTSSSFIGKYSKTGERIWSYSISSLQGERYTGIHFGPIALGQDDKIYVCGAGNGSIGLWDGSVASFEEYGKAFFLILNKDSKIIQKKLFPMSIHFMFHDIAINADGEIFLIGALRDSVDLSDVGGPELFKLDLDRPQYGFILKLNANSEFQWIKTWGGTHNRASITPMDIAFDLAGNLIIAGTYQGENDFNPDQDIEEMRKSVEASEEMKTNSDGSEKLIADSDSFLMSFSPDGNLNWVHTWGSYDWDQADRICVDSDGYIYASGYYKSPTNFDTNGDGKIIQPSDEDPYIVKYSPDGIFQWVRTFGGPESDIGSDLKIGADNNLYLIGRFPKTTDFCDGPEVHEITSNGNHDIYLVSYDLNGEFRWVRTWGSPYLDTGSNIGVLSNGNLIISGVFKDTVEFDQGSVTSHGQTDIFVAEITDL